MVQHLNKLIAIFHCEFFALKQYFDARKTCFEYVIVILNIFRFINIIFILTTHNLYEKKKIIYHSIQNVGRQQGISDNNVRHNSIQYQSRFAYFGRWLHELAALSAQRNISFRFIWGCDVLFIQILSFSFGLHYLFRNKEFILKYQKIHESKEIFNQYMIHLSNVL